MKLTRNTTGTARRDIKSQVSCISWHSIIHIFLVVEEIINQLITEGTKILCLVHPTHNVQEVIVSLERIRSKKDARVTVDLEVYDPNTK